MEETEERNRRWITIGPEQAQEHPLYGILGWPVLVLARIFVGAAQSAYAAAFQISFMARHDLPVKPLAAGSLAISVMWTIVFLMLGAMLLSKVRLFINLYVCVVAVGILWTLAGPLVASLTVKNISIEQVVAAFNVPLLLAIVAVDIALCVYVVLSRRINVTTKHRVRPDDAAVSKRGSEG